MSDALEPVYLICGNDRPKVLRALARLRDRFAGAEATFDAGCDPETVIGAAQQMGLFSGGRLVVAHGVEAWRKDQLPPLDRYLAAPAPDTVVALVGAGVRRDGALAKLLQGPCQLRYDLPTGAELLSHLRSEARRLGADIEPDALRLLIELVGENAPALTNELDKLATHAAGEAIDSHLVEQLAFRGTGGVPFALTNAVSARDRRAAFRALQRSFDAGDKPHALLPQAANQVALLLAARRQRDAGGSPSELARAIAVHEFRAKKAMEAAGRWSERDAALAICRLAEADHAMKGGRRIGPELALERALALSV